MASLRKNNRHYPVCSLCGSWSGCRWSVVLWSVVTFAGQSMPIARYRRTRVGTLVPGFVRWLRWKGEEAEVGENRWGGHEEGFQVFRDGWPVGSDGFRREQWARWEGSWGSITPGICGAERPRPKPSTIIREALQRRDWRERNLIRRRRNGSDERAMAARLRRETPLSDTAIATRVHLGTAGGHRPILSLSRPVMRLFYGLTRPRKSLAS